MTREEIDNTLLKIGFTTQNWTPFQFQKDTWKAFFEGKTDC